MFTYVVFGENDTSFSLLQKASAALAGNIDTHYLSLAKMTFDINEIGFFDTLS